MLASTWLQCAPAERLNGPFLTPGGRSNIADVNAGIDNLHPDSGILWWLEYIKGRYGAWKSAPASRAASSLVGPVRTRKEGIVARRPSGEWCPRHVVTHQQP